MTISCERLEAMQQSWVRLLGRIGISPSDAYPPFDDLVVRYQEPQRHYHDLEHVAEVLKVVGKLADLATDLDAICLAAWYHDAVYDPRAKDNEEQSSSLMRTALAGLAVPAEVIDRAASMIRATMHTGKNTGTATPPSCSMPTWPFWEPKRNAICDMPKRFAKNMPGWTRPSIARDE